VSTKTSAAIGRSLELIDRASRLVEGHGREDLVDRLQTTRRRLTDPSIRVLFVGEYKKGKSQLINAIVNASVCRVDADIATAVPTVIRWADEPVAIVHPEAGNGGRPPPPERIPLDRFHTYLSEDAPRRIRLAEAGLPRPVLEGGLVLVDTPGIGGLSSAHGAATAAALPMADAVVFVTDASQELTAPELEFLKAASQMCPNIVCMLTKVDMYPEWKRIRDIDRGHLERAGLQVGLGAVSSAVRMHALRTGDAQADTESGVPSLIAFLRDRVVGSAEQILVRSVVHDVSWSLGRLETALASERTMLADPSRSTELVAELERAKERATDLRDRGARWQQVLGDGISDLSSNVDHDLRARFREIVRVAEDALDCSDPADAWDEFQPWLYRRMNAEITQNYAAMTAGVEELAGRIAEVFDTDASSFVDSLTAEVPLESIGATPVALDPKAAKKPGIGEQAMTILRGTYGPVLMFSMLGTVVGVGLTLSNPLLLAAGAAMGIKGLRDHRTRDLEQRRQRAKAAVRKFVDDVSFQVIKDKTDRLRQLHRDLRDAFAGRAAELQRSAADALAAAQRSVQTDHEQRKRRLDELQKSLGAITAVRAEAGSLPASAVPVPA
jgi:hypothetical protein